jgi:hypothetical protein
MSRIRRFRPPGQSRGQRRRVLPSQLRSLPLRLRRQLHRIWRYVLGIRGATASVELFLEVVSARPSACERRKAMRGSSATSFRIADRVKRAASNRAAFCGAKANPRPTVSSRLPRVGRERSRNDPAGRYSRRPSKRRWRKSWTPSIKPTARAHSGLSTDGWNGFPARINSTSQHPSSPRPSRCPRQVVA